MIKFYCGFLTGAALIAVIISAYDMGRGAIQIETNSALPVAFGNLDDYYPPEYEIAGLAIPTPPPLPCFKLKTLASCEIESIIGGL
jgi:hypothetical protein